MVILQIEEDACTAFDKEQNKKIRLTYPLRNEEETGTIMGNIETAADHFIIELLDNKNEVIDSIRDLKKYKFTMIPPGCYKMRILFTKCG